jgi:hypothetical protein
LKNYPSLRVRVKSSPADNLVAGTNLVAVF